MITLLKEVDTTVHKVPDWGLWVIQTLLRAGHPLVQPDGCRYVQIKEILDLQ